MSSSVMADRIPPSTISILAATAILAVAFGYLIGQGSSLGLFGSTKSPPKGKSKNPKKSWPNSYDVTIHPDSSDEEVFKQIRGADLGIESEESSKDSSSEDNEVDLGQKQAGLNQFEGNREECKLVLVVRTDLGMGKGMPVEPHCILHRLGCDLLTYSLNNHRQDCSPMFPRNTRLLPSSLQHIPQGSQPSPQTVGAYGSGESRRTGKGRRAIGDAAGASSQSGTMRSDHP